MRSVIVFILLLALLACGKKDKPVKAPKENTVLSFFNNPEIEYIDCIFIDNFFLKHPEFSMYKTKLRKFYSRRNYELAWSKRGDFLPQADMLVNMMQYANLEGIDTIDISSTRLREQLLETKSAQINSHKGKSQRQEMDVLLSASYFQYAHKIWKGKVDPKAQNLEWYIEMKKIKYGKTLDSILSANHEINPFTLYEPLQEDYKRLKNALIRYKLIEEAGGWPEFNTSKNILRQGDSLPEIKQLKKLLFIMGDYKDDTTSEIFDIKLKQSVKQFQQRHGVETNGIVGGKTLLALKVPIHERIKQIIINMERWRWMPQKLTEDFIFVNIPDYKLHIFENGKEINSMRVIVGGKASLTPIFNDEIEYIVFNPYWQIPKSIASEEIAPLVAQNENYLFTEGIEIVDRQHNIITLDSTSIVWDTITENFPYFLKQKPGPTNPLGRVKFIFPNTYSVYLHDTPGRHLFDEKQRGFSHGCIRVEDPIFLARYLLSGTKRWNEKRINSALESAQETWVKLSQKMPVYIVYFTSWADEKGNIHFRNDIYQHDRKLSAIFFEK